MFPKNTKSFIKPLLIKSKKFNNLSQFAAFSLCKNTHYSSLLMLLFYPYDFYIKSYQTVTKPSVFKISKHTRVFNLVNQTKNAQKQITSLQPSTFSSFFKMTPEQHICPNILWYFFISAGSLFHYSLAYAGSAKLANTDEKPSDAIKQFLSVVSERIGSFEERETVWNHKQTQTFLQSYINESILAEKFLFVPSISLSYIAQSNNFAWMRFYQILNRQGILKASFFKYRCHAYSFYLRNTSLLQKFSSILRKWTQITQAPPQVERKSFRFSENTKSAKPWDQTQIKNFGPINPIINRFGIFKNKVISNSSVYAKKTDFISSVNRAQNFYFRIDTFEQNSKVNNILSKSYVQKAQNIIDQAPPRVERKSFDWKQNPKSAKPWGRTQQNKSWINPFLKKQLNLYNKKPNLFSSFNQLVLSRSIKSSKINSIIFLPRITQFLSMSGEQYLFKSSIVGYDPQRSKMKPQAEPEKEFFKKASEFYGFGLPIFDWESLKGKNPQSLIYQNSFTNRKITKRKNLTHYFNNMDTLFKIPKKFNVSFQPVSYQLFSTEQVANLSKKISYLPVKEKKCESIMNSSVIFGEFFKNSDTIELGIQTKFYSNSQFIKKSIYSPIMKSWSNPKITGWKEVEKIIPKTGFAFHLFSEKRDVQPINLASYNVSKFGVYQRNKQNVILDTRKKNLLFYDKNTQRSIETTKIFTANYSYSISLDRTYNLILRYLHEIKRSMTLSRFIESKIRTYTSLPSEKTIRSLSWLHLTNLHSQVMPNIKANNELKKKAYIAKQNTQEKKLIESDELKFAREGSGSTCLISEFYLEPLILKNVIFSTTQVPPRVSLERFRWKQNAESAKPENIFSPKWYISIYNFNYFWHFIPFKFDIVISRNLNHFRNARYKLNEIIINHRKEITQNGLNKTNHKHPNLNSKFGITVPFQAKIVDPGSTILPIFVSERNKDAAPPRVSPQAKPWGGTQKKLPKINSSQIQFFKSRKKFSLFQSIGNTDFLFNHKNSVGVKSVSLLQETVNLHSSYFDAFQINTFNQIYFINAVASLSNTSKSSDITQGVPLLKRYFDLPKDSPIHLLLKQTFEKYYSYSNIPNNYNASNQTSTTILNKKNQKKHWSWSKIVADFSFSPVFNKSKTGINRNREMVVSQQVERQAFSADSPFLIPYAKQKGSISNNREAKSNIAFLVASLSNLESKKVKNDSIISSKIPALSRVMRNKTVSLSQVSIQPFYEASSLNEFKSSSYKSHPRQSGMKPEAEPGKYISLNHQPQIDLERCLKLRTIALKYSLIKILQKIVNNVQAVYRGQGVEIYDQHIEVLVSQMGFTFLKRPLLKLYKKLYVFLLTNLFLSLVG